VFIVAEWGQVCNGTVGGSVGGLRARRGGTTMKHEIDTTEGILRVWPPVEEGGRVTASTWKAVTRLVQDHREAVQHVRVVFDTATLAQTHRDAAAYAGGVAESGGQAYPSSAKFTTRTDFGMEEG
jgi:hypothetical protein